jgi:enamine deaminase RidA (YjgF/YER057c/UK114 family)
VAFAFPPRLRQVPSSVMSCPPSSARPVIQGVSVKREIIRVEPLSTYLENWKAPTSAVTRCGDTIYVSGFSPFDPDTGKVIEASIERQTELVLEQ